MGGGSIPRTGPYPQPARSGTYRSKGHHHQDNSSRGISLVPTATTVPPVLTLPNPPTLPTAPTLPNMPNYPTIPKSPFPPRPPGMSSTYIEFTLRPRELVNQQSPTAYRPSPPPPAKTSSRSRDLPPDHPDAEYRPPQPPRPAPTGPNRYPLRSTSSGSSAPISIEVQGPQKPSASASSPDAQSPRAFPLPQIPSPPLPRRHSSIAKPSPPRKPVSLRNPRRESRDEEIKFTFVPIPLLPS